ncbi:Uncharacterised protein [uncultured archaeon]|nr:Uncharacterised protein [uncultured archaeon]
MYFLKFSFSSDMLILGERFKKGQYRPVITTIPYSQITGALQAKYGNGKYNGETRQIHACGNFLFKDEAEEADFREKHIKILTYSPRNRSLDSSIIPIYTEYLHNVEGVVYVQENDDVNDILKQNSKINFWMGGLKSKGFGKCELNFKGRIDTSLGDREGELNTRLPILKLGSSDFGAGTGDIEKLINEGKPTKFLQDVFGIKKVKTANFGYLFEPISETEGKYVLSLFENSIVEAPEYLLKIKGEKMIDMQTDDVAAKVIDEIRSNVDIGYLSNKFLNTVGDILEKEGLTMTETFLLERRSRRDMRQQAETLLKVLKIIKNNPSVDRKTARFIIKSLISIKSKEV